jgi:hypothetical protein
MTWRDAIDYVSKQVASKQMSNRDASGLILFARAAQRVLEAQADPLNVAPSMAFDWYARSLPALGWVKRGDKFVMTDKWQHAPYADATELLANLSSLASMLDAQGIPFKMLRSPQGNAESYKQLALDSYHLMQRTDPSAADVHGPPPHTASKPQASGSHPHKPHKPKKTDAVQPVSVDPLPPETPPIASPVPTPGQTHVVQPPSLIVDHPDGGQVSVTPPPVIVPTVVAPPSGGNAASMPARGDTVPMLVTPPAIIIPPTQPNGQPFTVQPEPMPVNAPLVPHPQDAEQPGDWYWRKHAHDNDPPPYVDTTGEMMDVSADVEAAKKKPKPKAPAGNGDAAGILLLIAVLALSE